MDIELRGELWDNDSADVLRWWGWRDIIAPMDIAAMLEKAGGEDITILVNSPGGNMVVGGEIRSMLRRYKGRTTALIQGYAASAATMAISGCDTIQCEPGALLCYHNPSTVAEGDFHQLRRDAEGMKNARDAIIEQYMARSGCNATAEELAKLMDKDIWISPTQAKEYGLIDEIVGLDSANADPAPFVAAAGNGRIRLTAEMVAGYQAAKAEENAKAQKEQDAKRAMAHLRVLAKY